MLIRGTTPTIRYTFKTVDPAEITAAYLTLKFSGGQIEKDLTAATVGTKYLEWQLTQTETLALKAVKNVEIQLRYKTTGGDAYATPITLETAARILKDGEI